MDDNYHGEALTTTRDAWKAEIEIMKNVISSLSDANGQIVFEYDIPRLGKRIDVVLLYRGMYKYLATQKLISENPTLDLRSPKTEKRLPHYLTFQQSFKLLNNIDGRFKARNLAIITLFLNCGIRLSELVGLNFTSISERNLKVLGKGNKERVLYLNDACMAALETYYEERKTYKFKIVDRDALFISQKGNRISQRMVQTMVHDFMLRCDIDTREYSVHKLRHTAATLMYQSGVDIRALQEILGHSTLGTTQIYTHVKNSQIEESMRSISLSATESNTTESEI